MKKSRVCKLCKKPIKGRIDKIWCSIECKNSYHLQLRRAAKNAAMPIDNILHRNYEILLEILGKHKNQVKVDRLLLDRKKFRYNFITQYHINSRNKTVHYVYDISWIIFSDQEILIKRIRR